ncbi:AbfB domain-containing protein [Actinoplanes bogorensis]|uniref:AbfB domain-containing protein n=1 Tax=Paractinoplanes bogorensis TaxID=1610840 RepID=A0ABS5Z3I1_9ACTN|nr:AbfB domain-containing protein [Actinoplanes bogorensis]MBU2670254.1 AbfB domain-containing protein [Actinoplanes bogorensis]
MRVFRWCATVLALLLTATITLVTPAQAAVTGGARILPLGDSITDGFNVPGGYRINLWRALTGAGHLVDFVGSQSNGPTDLPDREHEGHSGWRIDQVDAQATGWVTATAPRSVLVHLGTNDIVQNYDVANAPARLSALIDRIRAAAPNADVFVASIVPFSDPAREAAANNYNARIPGIVSGKGAKVHFVDMHAALTTAQLADGVHPNREGYDRMAARWAAALASVPGSAGDDGAATTLPTGFRSLRVTTGGYTDRYVRHQGGLGFTEHVDGGSSALLKQDATWQIVPGLAGGCYSLQSRNYPGYYLRHQNSRVRISADDGTTLMRADATWCARSAPGGVRLASWNFPGSYLRHYASELWLATPGGANSYDNVASIAPDVTWSIDAAWSAP